MTVPSTDTTLDSFTFYVDLPTNLIFRGEVYAWDPNTFAMGSATGPALYASGPMQTTSYGMGFSPHPITFNIPGGLPLTAGAQYVLFFTTSKDAQNPLPCSTSSPTCGFVGFTLTDTYSGGNWVFIDDGGDPSQWTIMEWTQPALLEFPFGDDLAFQATFSPPKPLFAGTPGSPNCHGTSVSALAQQNGGLAAAATDLGFASVPALQNAITGFCGS